jgi:hypothetical protein
VEVSFLAPLAFGPGFHPRERGIAMCSKGSRVLSVIGVSTLLGVGLFGCYGPQRVVYQRVPVTVPCRDSSAVVSSFGSPMHCDHGATLTYAPYEHPSNDRHDLFVATCRCPEEQAYATVPVGPELK